MPSRLALALASVLALLPACAPGGGDDGGDDTSTPLPDGRPPDGTNACGSLAGRWGITGGCGADLCTITQANCTITALTCNSGAHSTSGSLSGNQFTYTGVSGANTPATCTGTITGTSFAGSCNIAGAGTCPFTGDRL